MQKVLAVLNSLTGFNSIGRRSWLASLLLLYSALSHAQSSGEGAPLLPGTLLLPVTSSAGNLNVQGVNNLTPDVFGITDLISSSDSQSSSFSPSCEGVACGDGNRTTQLPGLVLEQRRRTSDTCDDTDSDGICDDGDYCLGTTQGAKVLSNGCGLVPGIPLVLSGVRFSPGSANLTAMAKAYLDEVVALVRELAAPKLVVEGHTDDQGSETDNMALSLRRAEVVYRYLANATGPGVALAYKGYGENFPLVPNRTDTGQLISGAAELNRRIELRWAEDTEFAQAQAEMRQREEKARLALAREKEAQQAAQRQKLEKQQQVESANKGYNEVLEFLEQSGSAKASEPQTSDLESSPADSDDSETPYQLELVYPDK